MSYWAVMLTAAARLLLYLEVYWHVSSLCNKHLWTDESFEFAPIKVNIPFKLF